MSYKHVDAGFDLPFGRAKLLVYLVLCRYANGKTSETWPSNAKIAEITWYDSDYVAEIVRELCRDGWIKKIAESKRGQPARYEIVPNGGGLSLPNGSDEGGLSLPKNAMGRDYSVNGGGLSRPTYKDARAFEPGREPGSEEEDTQIELDTDSRTSEPTALADVCVSLQAKTTEESQQEESPEPELGAVQLGGPVPAACRHYSEIACPCEQQALRTMTELFIARPTLAKPRRHPNLHLFLHVPGREPDDLKILIEDRLAREKDDDFLKMGTLFSPGKAEEDLAAAKARQEAEQAKRRRTICLHPADEVIHDERDDSFVCRACWCTISEQQANKRGVQRESRRSDAEARAGLQEFRQAIFGRGSNRSQRHE